MSNSLYFPIHHGLLSPEHFENIGPALWEFIWLISKVTKEVNEDGETIGIVLGGKPVKMIEIVDELGGSLRTTKRNVSRLKEHGYISTKRTPYGVIYKVRNSKKFYKNRSAKSGTSKKGEVPNMDERSAKSGQEKCQFGTSNKKKKEKEKKDNIYVEIIGYLNQKAGKRFSAKSTANQKIINGRISEGRTAEDFKHVIDVKVEEWLDNAEMNQYLRPSTLFRPNNFENYLNQKTKIPEKQVDPRDREIALQEWMMENPNADPDDFVYEED